MTLTTDPTPDTITTNHPPATPPCGLKLQPTGRAKSETAQAPPWKSQPRPQQADAVSISTPTPSKSLSRGGVAVNSATVSPSESTIRCSRTNTANSVHPESISQLF